jgi:hypothetical protein
MTESDVTIGRLPIEDKDLVNARTAYEVGRRRYLAALPATRLAAFMSLAGEGLKTSTVCELLKVDEGELYRLFTNGYNLSQEQLDLINGLYTIGSAAWHESNGNWREARARLTKKSHMLIKDPADSSSPERSILKAVTDGDLEQVLSIADYQVGDFNSDVTAKDF